MALKNLRGSAVLNQLITSAKLAALIMVTSIADAGRADVCVDDFCYLCQFLLLLIASSGRAYLYVNNFY